ncbi:DUF1249 domain-containing protein [Gayadomonas joobiniege]|uniref:DUF1249 domain-containing protein n=1 Tax=Gayadomonas joobiniege TaxID=1234606 RepID=UPI0003603477|nr:DUF1249 domain-containing protein [Gayadomonas joobiniege]
MNKVAKKYIPDIALMNRVCEQNYFLLSGLVSNWRLDHIEAFETGPQAVFQIRVQHSSRFTNEIEMRQLSNSMPDIMQPKVRIRVYHDAKMAEVIASQNMTRIQPSYIYPNPHMHQPDEKMQINQFLYDWLSYCHEHGMALPDQVFS